MQALAKGAITVLGGNQTRPNIHIDDLVDVYLFALDRELSGVYNAGFENLTVMEIAKAVTREIPASIDVRPSNDPRSYFVCSDKLLGTGFAPTRTVQMAIREMAAAYHDGRLTDEPISYNVLWMRQNSFA
jgi:nucleoside-diphosphate-sugar epimerase